MSRTGTDVARPPQTFSYGWTLIEIFEGFVRTTLPDGATIDAHPVSGPEHEARALALGYADVWAMTRDHDRFHALLAHALGLEESPALRATVRGEASELTGVEEEVVLAMQRFANLCRAAGLL